MSSIPQNYTISDFIEWYNKKQLVLAPEFQRGAVWTQTAKVFLIDTILNELPIPQVYFRTKVDPITQTTIREVVDGQQRLRSILEFASGKLVLTAKAPKHRGMKYLDLETDDQERFLSYKISAVQLLNATDEKVLEVFARLNSYSVKVSAPELRHAEYSEPVKWAIYDAARDWHSLWNQYKIVSMRESVRLKNTSLIAEFFMMQDIGLSDGGENNISKYYKKNLDKSEDYFANLRGNIDEVLKEIITFTGDDFLNTTFYKAPNFLMLFGAVSFLKELMPRNKFTDEVDEFYGAGINWQSGLDGLANLAQAFDENIEGSAYVQFVSATKSTTHRVSSRKPRFNTLVRLLAGA